MDDEVCSQISCILSYTCTLSTERLKIASQIIPISRNVRDLGVNYSFSVNFSEPALTLFEKGNKIVGLPIRAFKLNQSKQNLVKTHAGIVS